MTVGLIYTCDRHGDFDPMMDCGCPSCMREARNAIALAYGYLFHVNNVEGLPNNYPPEKAAYAARHVLRDLMTSEQRGDAINKAAELIAKESEK